MAEDDPQQERTLQVVATGASEAEADLICQRLAEAGIQATAQRSIGAAQFGASGSRYVYVEADELGPAREALAASDGISDEELAKMAEDAAPTQQRKPAKGEPIEIPVPKISAVRAAIRKLARTDKSPGK